jgi:uncharacterized membrane protein
MTLLVIGNILWVIAHSFKRVLPNLRNSLGNAGKGAVAISLIIALVLIVTGYRSAEYVAVWTPPNFLVHINNILMLTAILVFALGHTRGRLRGRLRHPMLTSVKIWAVAHLLVNGDLASLILFGSMLAWAVLAVILINRSETRTAPKPGTAKRDIVLVFMVVFIFLLISALHWFFGVWPFPGGLSGKIL